MEELGFDVDTGSFLEHAQSPRVCTCISYQYCDAGNFKTNGEALIRGVVKPEVFARLVKVMFDSDSILPRQLGLPALSPEPWGEGYDDELDHSLHTIEAVRWREVRQDDQFDTDAETFAASVDSVKSESDWNFGNFG